MPSSFVSPFAESCRIEAVGAKLGQCRIEQPNFRHGDLFVIGQQFADRAFSIRWGETFGQQIGRGPYIGIVRGDLRSAVPEGFLSIDHQVGDAASQWRPFNPQTHVFAEKSIGAKVELRPQKLDQSAKQKSMKKRGPGHDSTLTMYDLFELILSHRKRIFISDQLSGSTH